jgi:diguanylate cyclase
VKRAVIFLGSLLVAGMSLAYFVVEPTANSKLFLYNGVGVISLIAMVVGIRINKPQHRAPWVCFSIGQALFLTGDVIYYLLDRSTNGHAPFPSIADGFYLSMYPMMVTGLLLITRRHTQGRGDRAGLIDAGIFGIATFSILWVLVMDSYVTGVHASAGDLISTAYPVMDLALVFVAVRLVVVLHRRHPALMFMIAGLCSLVTADVQFGVANKAGAYTTGGVIDAFWLGFYVLMAAAVLHPSMAQESVSDGVDHDHLSDARLTVMFVTTLTVPLIDLIWGEPRDRFITLTSSAALFGLMLARVLGLVRSVERGQDDLQREARHDPLTGLANRTQFAERTEEAIASGSGDIAVLLVDLDDFKAVNDSLGHEAGDVVLNTVAERLARSVRDGDLVARLGGDEFAVLMTKVIDRHDAANTAARVIRALEEPITLSERRVKVGGSVGVSVQNDLNGDVQALLRGADTAMYLSKRLGKGRYTFFEQHHHTELVARIEMKADLERALSLGEFEIHYQPIVDTDSAMIRSVEALLRWHHPVLGNVPPDKFIPLAEESGDIIPIGKWVLTETCKQVRAWQQSVPHCSELRASVNLSAVQLNDPELLHIVTEALRISGLAPEHLMLEVTESLLISDSTSALHFLEQLTAMKVKIAIDDFGTGYSSLSYLHAFPVDTIKVDRSFVMKLDESSTSNALVRTVIELARAIGATTVAEGVEFQNQLDVLSELRCDLVQGYLFSRPLTSADLATFLLKRNAKEELPVLPKRRGIKSAAKKSVALPAKGAGDFEVIRGVENIKPLLGLLEKFHAEVKVPVTARWAWLSTWFELHPDTDLHAVIVRRVPDRIDGAAIFARRRVNGVNQLFTVDNQSAAVASVFARNEKSAEALVRGIVALVGGSKSRLELSVNRLSSSNRVLPMLQKSFPVGTLEAELAIPQVLLQPDLSMNELLGRGMRKQLRRAVTKVEAHGRKLTFEFHCDTATILTLLPEVEAIHVGRDHDRRCESDLDNAQLRRFWQEAVVMHSYNNELELAILKIDGTIAAYVISFVDGDTYRVFDGRMKTEFSEYSPGRILEAATLERAIADSNLAVFDWMTGVAPDTILAANFWDQRVTFNAVHAGRSSDGSFSPSLATTNDSSLSV